MQTNVKRGKIEFARGYLADLYEDAHDYARTNGSVPGAYTVSSALSDAIDALDRALAARGSDETAALGSRTEPDPAA